ncbi:hypothetical protein QQF64_016581 [Cirrhinus molitorella]|uniref:CCHC-type domain-containing protein n=1 Tax=Cirrhinus molitorella TaxID=172907 RepID=A0ABR3LRW5_9TELE
MATFDLDSFVENPTVEKLDRCRKDDLVTIASHYQISEVKQSFKKEAIKAIVYNRLVELNVLVRSESVDAIESTEEVVTPVRRESVEDLSPATEVEAEVRARLPPFEPFSPSSTASKGETRLKVRLARLQLEAQDKAQSRQAEMDLRLQIRKMEIEADKQVKMRQLELDAMRIVGRTATAPDPSPVTTASVPPTTPVNTSVRHPPTAPESFDVSKHIVLVPHFRETEVDSYFSAFERIATSLYWPKDLWAILLQCRLVGKALEVFSTLSIEESLNYETVKSTILRAYELVPEAYRQKFRGHKRKSGQTYVEFAREKATLFDKWCTASKIDSFESLRELILLEEFKGCLPERVVTYLNEQKVSSLSQAAVLADEYILTHKGVFSVTRSDRNVSSGSAQNQNTRVKSAGSPSNEVKECFYCRKPGHLIAECPALKRKQQVSQSKSVALLKTVLPPCELENEAPDLNYKPFVMSGTVSLTGSVDDQKEVRILRDTGANQSIMLADVLPFSDESYCGSNVLVRGIEMQVVPIPMHHVHLNCTLVSGLVRVGVRKSLPVKGISFILGNDLAGGKVMPGLEVIDLPKTNSSMDEMANVYPDVFSACAVTRAQGKNWTGTLNLPIHLWGRC